MTSLTAVFEKVQLMHMKKEIILNIKRSDVNFNQNIKKIENTFNKYLVRKKERELVILKDDLNRVKKVIKEKLGVEL